MKRILYAFLSLVLVVGCEMNLVDEVETTDQVLGGDQSGDIFLSPYWDWADAWPGPISMDLARVDGVEVTVKGGYSKFSFDESVFPLQSTGVYAAMAETIQIELPADAPSNMYCQIGMGHALAEGQHNVYRYSDVVTTFELIPGEVNRCLSYFGGFVYIYYNHDEGDIPATDYTLTINNVVESNDFIYGETDERNWINTMFGDDISDVLPWVELRSDKVILTVYIDDILSTDAGPSSILEQWETLIDAQVAFAGLTNDNEMPVRIMSDVQVPDATQTASSTTGTYTYYGKYPATLVRSTTSLYQDRLLNIDILQASQSSDYPTWYDPINMIAEMCSASWVEIDSESPTFGVDVIASTQTPTQYKALLLTPYLNLATYYYTYKCYGTIPSLDIDFTGAVEKLRTGQCPLDDYGDVYMMPTPAEKTRYKYATSAGGTTVLSYDERSTMFMQLIQQSDWALISYINNRARSLGFENNVADIYDNYTFMAMCASEYLNVNLKPFFDYWGCPITAVAGDYMEQFPDLQQEYYYNGEPAYFFEVEYDEAKNFEIQFTQTRTPVTFSSFPTYDYTFHRYEFHDYFKDIWYFKGMYYYNELTDAETFGDTVFVSQLDLDNDAWFMMDGQASTGVFPKGNVHESGRTYDSIYFLMFFDQELEINALSHMAWNLGSSNFRVADRMTEIQYLDLSTGDSLWLPTVPDHFEFLRYEAASDDYVDAFYHYYFFETYKTAGLRFHYEPIYSGQASNKQAWMGDIHPAYYGSQYTIDAFPAGTFIH